MLVRTMKRIWNLAAILLIAPLLLFCSKEEPEPQILEPLPLSPVHQYFVEVAFGKTYISDYRAIRKWEEDIKLFVPETQYLHLNEELDTIISELNTLIGDIKIEKVSNLYDANYVVYFGRGSDYAEKYESNASGYVQDFKSLFWIYSSNWRIYGASIYVDVFRETDEECQKHRLREELTQSLGLMLDSNEYPLSIFYDEETCVTEYTDLDRKLIKILYDPNITPGMSRRAVEEYLASLQIIL